MCVGALLACFLIGAARYALQAMSCAAGEDDDAPIAVRPPIPQEMSTKQVKSLSGNAAETLPKPGRADSRPATSTPDAGFFSEQFGDQRH